MEDQALFNDSSVSVGSSRHRRRLLWLVCFSLLLGITNGGIGWISLRPPAEGVYVNYWPFLIYTRAFWPTFTAVPLILFLSALTLAAYAHRQKSWELGGGSIVLLLGAGLFAGVTYGFLLMGGFEHLGGVEFNGQIYNLGQDVDTDGFSTYALCECNDHNIACHCHYFYQSWGNLTSEPEILIDPVTSDVPVQLLEAQLVYIHSVSPRCKTNPEIGICMDE